MEPMLHATLRDALKFHLRRDQMNAALHQQPVRWSPLTLSLAEACRDQGVSGSMEQFVTDIQNEEGEDFPS